MINRKDILENLVQLLKPLSLVSMELKQLSWDEYDELVVIERGHVINVLRRYLLDEITPEDVEEWANLIECREDLIYEELYEEEIKESIFRLANPVLEGSLDFKMARTIIHCLESMPDANLGL